VLQNRSRKEPLVLSEAAAIIKFRLLLEVSQRHGSIPYLSFIYHDLTSFEDIHCLVDKFYQNVYLLFLDKQKSYSQLLAVVEAGADSGAETL
jgi:hypothetical protein